MTGYDGYIIPLETLVKLITFWFRSRWARSSGQLKVYAVALYLDHPRASNGGPGGTRRFYAVLCASHFARKMCLSIHHSIYHYLYFDHYLYPSILPFIHPSVHPSVHSSVHPSFSLSIAVSLHLSRSLSLYLSIYLPMSPSLLIYSSRSLDLFLPFSLYLISVSPSSFLSMAGEVQQTLEWPAANAETIFKGCPRKMLLEDGHLALGFSETHVGPSFFFGERMWSMRNLLGNDMWTCEFLMDVRKQGKTW